jgi:hypothetical protein
LDRLRAHRDYLEGEWQAAQAAPLSMRKAMLVARLIDAYVDRMFAAQAEPGDILEFRAGLAARNSALRMVFDLCAQRINGPRLVIEAVQVPIRDYGTLSVEDFMVSLYNDHSVQRLRLVLPDGTRTDMLETLGEAMAGLD